MSGENFVSVQNVFKSFGCNEVLKDVNMKLRKSSVYALLGASGCGKSTLLSCIIGICTLDKGQIIRSKKMNVGYMPQDISLIMEFTVEETMIFYGRIHKMKKKDVETRFKELNEILKVEIGNKFVENYSGGQKRRISLMVALLHDPELLILDEPTVGLDCIIRKRVWDFFLFLVKEKQKTVIITTHYLEEARRSDIIGFMHAGTIMAEGTPADLLLQCGTDTLENAFVYLETHAEEFIGERKEFRKSSTISRIKERTNLTHVSTEVHHIIALIIKNCKVFLRTKIFLLYYFILPFLSILSVCIAVEKQINEIPFGVINNDVFNSTCEIFDSCTDEHLSCIILKHLEAELAFEFIPFESEFEAIAKIKTGNLWGVMKFPQNYSTNYFDRMIEPIRTYNEINNSSKISLKMDESNKMLTASVKYFINKAENSFRTDIFKSCNFTRNPPLIFKEESFYDDESRNRDFGAYIYSGIPVVLEFYLPCILSSLFLAEEIRGFMTQRLLVSGVSKLSIFLSLGTFYFFITLIQIVVGVLTAAWCLKITILGSTTLFVTLLALQGIAGYTFGFLITEISLDIMKHTTFNFWFFNFIMDTGGAIWLTEANPDWLNWIHKFLPLGIPVQSSRAIVLQGYGFTHPKVYPGFIVTAAYIVIFSVLSMIIVKLKK